MDPLNPFDQKPKKKPQTKSHNFIEALKEIGSSIKDQAKEATLGAAKNAVDQITGTAEDSSSSPMSEQSFDFEEFLKSREKQVEYIERKTAERKIEQERLVFNRKEEETQQQIKFLAEELKKLAKETEGLDLEVKKATEAAFVDPGAYHFSFLERIRRIIALARKQIAESRTWLQTWNDRAKKRSHYWFNVKKSGTKFMLSGERSVATSKG